MSSIETIIKRTVSSVIDDVVNYVVTGSAKFLEKIRIYLPKYELKMHVESSSLRRHLTGVQTRFFVTLDPKKKGKKAVYISQLSGGMTMFISYLSKNEIKRLLGNDEMFISDLVGDRWIITYGRHKFDTSFQLFGCIVAIEDYNKPSKRCNKPPVGNETKWIEAGVVAKNVYDRTRSIMMHTEISHVELSRYSIEEKLNHVQ